MPITPQGLKNRTRAITFAFGDFPVNVTYRPAAIPTNGAALMRDWMTRANAAETEADANAIVLEFAEFVCEVVTKWDYLEDDGETVQALTPENVAAAIQAWPDFILAILVNCITDKNTGKVAAPFLSASSGATSSQTAEQTAAPMDSQAPTA